MKVVVTGGSGFIGSALVPALVKRGHQVIVIDRRLGTPQKGVIHHRCDLVKGRLQPAWFAGADAIIHLAGANLFIRWSRRYKRRLRSSRVDSAINIAETISRLTRAQRPPIIITASAVGYYGNGREGVLTERSPCGRGFLAELCRDWESVWQPYLDNSCRFVAVRAGAVLDGAGGSLGMLAPLYRRGLGGVVGDGRQWLSWISRRDLINIYIWALEDNQLEGPINAVAPKPIRQSNLTRQLAQLYGSRPRLMIPSWLVRLVLGDTADLVLFSQRVKPGRLMSKGYVYQDITPHTIPH